MNSKDKEKVCLCRQIYLERISAYTLESFEKRMLNLVSIDGVDRFWMQPIAMYIDE